MTVKCLPDVDKKEIAELYSAKLCSTEDLQQAYGVSKRTINRVLVERGVNRARARSAKSEGVTAVQLTARTEPVLHIDMIELSFMDKVQCMLKAIFWRTPKQENAQIRKY